MKDSFGHGSDARGAAPAHQSSVRRALGPGGMFSAIERSDARASAARAERLSAQAALAIPPLAYRAKSTWAARR